VRALLGDIDGAREALDQAKRLPEAAAGDVVPRLKAALGELAWADGRIKDARLSFEEASRLWTDELPDAASVESRAYVGLIDGLAGHPAARALVDASLEQARRMKRPALEAETRVFLARVDLQARQPAPAAAALTGIHMEPLGPELQAQVHFWRGQAAAALGTGDGGQHDRQEARRLLGTVQEAVPADLRARFLSRPDRQALAD
jgi:hypothetical protein